MARGRMINQTIDYDPEFNALSLEAQLIYLRTLAFLDRDGLIIGHPRALLSKVAPLMENLQTYMVDIIDEWVEQGLVIRYTLKIGDILFFKGFAKNQSGMHYDREGESRFAPPPGWTHGPKGLVPIEAIPPPSSNGNSPPTPSGATPAKVLQDSRKSPAQIEVKDQDQQEGGDRARMTEPPPAQPSPPPATQYATLPGVAVPRWNQAKRDCDAFMVQAKQLGIDPDPFRRMFNMILEATGKLAVAEADPTESYLNEAKQTAITLAKMGFATTEDVQRVLLSWQRDDWRGASAPTFKQVIEHASAMLAGTHITVRRQDSGKKDFSSFADYNEWAASNDPQYKRIREGGVMIKGTLIKRADYRPAISH